MDSEALTMIVVMPTMFLIFGYGFKCMLNFFQQRQLVKQHYILQDKLLDKLGNSPEALEYLHSDAGEKLFKQLGAERSNPYKRILTALQAGSVILLLGVGFIVVPNLVVFEDSQGFTVIGVLAVCLGLGFLASSAAALFFSKSWGLINGNEARDDD